jgi:D-alanyl-D-alanine carboxypeptidase
VNYLILIDSVNPVPEDPDLQLADIQNCQMEKTAAFYCRRLLEGAAEDGVEIKILSAYRTAEYQRQLWNRSVLEYVSDGVDRDSAERLTARYLAAPGHSEHQSGLACDFCSPDWDDTQDDFYNTPEGRWLCANAARYGFILRYPRMKEHITGVSYEPWHYRYVGAKHAGIIRSQGLTLEEYLYYYCPN